MVSRDDFYYCGREIPPEEVHYILAEEDKKQWHWGSFKSLYSYCSRRSSDIYHTCEMCDACTRRNGIVW